MAAGDGVLTGRLESNVISTAKGRKMGFSLPSIGCVREVECESCSELHTFSRHILYK